ncbi:putative sulfate exporter family transporter [Kutzneria sp. 744]|uniref:putative sulfate exporter family transporter n=1 Tax=Kutzneria sp. (strain 744) TaxID=345341 RepID=UPI0003EEC8EA|nr:putative sulfate exporter family transporter [Kutzneria sp. 744]EWM10771.1 membrane protein [Kutzneria sp. 744]
MRSLGKATGTARPDIEYALWAIVIGLPALFRPGVASYGFWLKTGIVLLGARLVLGDLARLGGFSLGVIAIDMAVATIVILLVGKAFGLNARLSTLLAIGTSICGVSAIIAGRGAIDADDEDSGCALGLVSKAEATSLGNLSK